MAFIAKLGEQSYTVEIEENGKSVYRVSVDGNEFVVDGKKTGRTNFSLIVDNRSFEIEVDNREDEYRVLVDGRNYHIHLLDERRVRVGGDSAGVPLQGRQKVSVPMPGKIIALLAAVLQTDLQGRRDKTPATGRNCFLRLRPREHQRTQPLGGSLGRRRHPRRPRAAWVSVRAPLIRRD